MAMWIPSCSKQLVNCWSVMGGNSICGFMRTKRRRCVGFCLARKTKKWRQIRKRRKYNIHAHAHTHTHTPTQTCMKTEILLVSQGHRIYLKQKVLKSYMTGCLTTQMGVKVYNFQQSPLEGSWCHLMTWQIVHLIHMEPLNNCPWWADIVCCPQN